LIDIYNAFEIADREEARSFCLKLIKEVYATEYDSDWHADLDSLLLPPAENWFSNKNNGAFRIARDPDSREIIAAGGLYNLDFKPLTRKRLEHRYGSGLEACQIVRVYIAASYRGRGIGSRIVGFLEADATRLGYNVCYLHADYQADKTLSFWRSSDYTEFGKFSYPISDSTGICVDFDKLLKAHII
jgi:GNAT superfamily N-acetyltransferase